LCVIREMTLRLLIFIFVLLTIGCNQIDLKSRKFEKKLVRLIEESGKRFIATEEKEIIDLKEITDFDWDRFKYIEGNESGYVLKDEIECYLNLEFQTEDLQLNKSRFYFFKNNKPVNFLEINQSSDLYFHFSNPCQNNEYYSGKFIVSTNSKKLKSSTVRLNQVCERNNFKGEQLVKYLDYTYLVTPLITSGIGKTYKYNVASKNLIDSIGINTMFNKEVKNQDGKIKISFDVVENRALSQNNFFEVINDTIIVRTDFYLNCYDKSKENVIYHCKIGINRSDIKMTDIKI